MSSSGPALFIQGYFRSLVDPSLSPTALRVALLVGSVLFVINHGAAVLAGAMTRERWVAACLTYVVPYAVNIHGQYISRARRGSVRPN